MIKKLNEDLYRDLVNNTRDLIQTVAPDGRFLFVNRAWLTTLGYRRREIERLSLQDIIHPDSAAHCDGLFNLARSGQGPVKGEADLVAKRGKKISVEVSAHTKFINGEPAYVQCILRDVSERRKAEEALLRVEALESSILSAIPHAVLGLRERRIIFANDAVEKVFGWKPGDLIGKSTRILYRNDEDYETIGRQVYPALEKKRTYCGDFPCRRKGGGGILCRISASVIGKEMKDRAIVVMYEDITERMRTQGALRESERKYVDLYQNAPDGYHSLGPDGTILEVNDTWIRMLGYPREAVVRRMKITDIIVDGGKRVFRGTFPLPQKKGGTEHAEYSLRKRDGSVLPVLINATAVYDEKGKFLKSRAIVRDISTRVEYREMLEHALSEWRITFDSMPYGVMLIDNTQKVLRVNRYVQMLYGLSFEGMVGRKYHELVYHDERPAEGCPLVESSADNCTKVSEYYDRSLGRHFMLQATPVSGKTGLIRSSVLALVDITEIKDKEKRLTESRDAFFNMLKELDYSYRELKGLFEGLVHSFVNAIDAKSPWTKGHSERVTSYALSIAKEMAIDEEEIETLRIASLLHDIGKIGTYDVILDKPKGLSHEEFNLINLHPVRGEEILRPIKQLERLLPVIRHHHERIDGRGYPDGLKGKDIPLLARIICVADSYDSMTSDRPYRPARDKEFAVAELRRCRGTQFDPVAVEAFLKVLERFGTVEAIPGVDRRST